MKQFFVILFFSCSFLTGFSQSISLPKHVIEEFSRHLNYAYSYNDNLKVFIFYSAKRYNPSYTIGDVALLVETVGTNPASRDIILRSFYNRYGTNENLLQAEFLGLNMKASSSIILAQYISEKYLIVERNERLADEAVEKKRELLAQKERILEENEGKKRRILFEKQEKIRTEEQEKQRKLKEIEAERYHLERQAKTKQLRLTVYPLDVYDKSSYNTYKMEVNSEIRKLIEESEVFINAKFSCKYNYVYKDSSGTVQNGFNMFKLIEGNGIPLLSSFSPEPPSYKIDGIEVPIELSINEIAIDLAQGTTEINIKKNGDITYLKGKPDITVQNLIKSAVDISKVGKNSITYRNGFVSDQAINVIKQKPLFVEKETRVKKKNNWVLYPLIIGLLIGGEYATRFL